MLLASSYYPNVRGQGTRHFVEGTLDPLVRRFHVCGVINFIPARLRPIVIPIPISVMPAIADSRVPIFVWQFLNAYTKRTIPHSTQVGARRNHIRMYGIATTSGNIWMRRSRALSTNTMAGINHPRHVNIGLKLCIFVISFPSNVSVHPRATCGA